MTDPRVIRTFEDHQQHMLIVRLDPDDPIVKRLLGDEKAQALATLAGAAVALARFMRAPDTDKDGKPADWTPGLDLVADFYAAVDAWEAL